MSISDLSAGIQSGAALCTLCLLPQPLWDYVHIISAVFRRSCFFDVLHPLWLFCLFFLGVPNAYVEELDRDISLELSVSRSLTLCTLCSYGCLNLFSFTAKRKFLWWWLSKNLIYTYSRMSLGIILLLCYLSKTIVFVFTSKSLVSLVPGFWPPEHCQGWVPSHEWALSPIR